MKNILIYGNGEVGKSIARLYTSNTFKEPKEPIEPKESIESIEPKESIESKHLKKLNNKNIKYILYFKDIKEIHEDISVPLDVLHVCIPYSNRFVDIVEDAIKKYNPYITFIHSTVPLRTTKSISSRCYNHDIVHSPVIGKHPNLTESIRTFSKMVGGYSDVAVEKACNHLVELGITPIVYNSPEETEAAKLLSTTYYGWNIFFMHMVKKFCEENNLDFENVYESTNHNYNENYKKMGVTNVQRPVLKYMGEGVGGHCVWENSKLIVEQDYPYIKEIAEKVVSLGKKEQ